MFFIYKIMGALGTPLGLFFLMTSSGLAVIALSQRRGRYLWVGMATITAALIGIIALSMPVVAGFLLHSVEGESKSLPTKQNPTAVIVLSGGFTRLSNGTAEPGPFTVQRLVEGAALAKQMGWTLILSGGMSFEGGDSLARSMERKIRDLGYDSAVLLEESSRTTWENMVYSAKVARENGFKQVVIVTNSFHMRRALWMARRVMTDMDIYCYPVGPMGDLSYRDPLRWIPSASALRDSTLAWREILGLTAYRIVNP
ncbi:MAG: YdcF family protein [Synergistales bacterium]|nr:YdcF family protein [Synergistales bacterium]